MQHHLLPKWNLYLLYAPVHLVCSISSQKYRAMQQSLWLCKHKFRTLGMELGKYWQKKPFRNANLTCADWGATTGVLYVNETPFPRDQKQGDEAREIRNEWCPNYGLVFLTTKLKSGRWDGLYYVRAHIFSLSLESSLAEKFIHLDWKIHILLKPSI